MNNDDGYEVTLLAKPHAAERKVEIAGQPMTMRMQTAETNDIVFAIGTVDLASADPALQRATLDFLQQALARNVNAQAAPRRPRRSIWRQAESCPAQKCWWRGRAVKSTKRRPVHVRFVAKGMHVY